MASTLLVEGAIQNDNTGQLVSVINADSSAAHINNAKVQGLVNLGTHAFSGYPLAVGTDMPAANESNFVANDNSGNLVAIINADTSTTKINNAKLAGNLVSSITGNNGITVSNPTGVGPATLGLSAVPNSVLAGPLVTGITAGNGITVTNNPGTGTGAPTVSLASSSVNASPIIRARTQEQQLTATTATTFLTYTPTATSSFYIVVFARVMTAATNLSLTLTYNDAAATAQTQTLLPTTSLAVGAYDMVGAFVVAGTAGAVAVSATAGTINQVYVSGSIWEV